MAIELPSSNELVMKAGVIATDTKQLVDKFPAAPATPLPLGAIAGTGTPSNAGNITTRG